MYTLIIDGKDESATGEFEEMSDPLWWYNESIRLGAESAALWADQALIKFYVKESEGEE